MDFTAIKQAFLKWLLVDEAPKQPATSATPKRIEPESLGLPPYPLGDVVGACVCGSWPGGKCLRCSVVPASETAPKPTAAPKPRTAKPTVAPAVQAEAVMLNKKLSERRAQREQEARRFAADQELADRQRCYAADDRTNTDLSNVVILSILANNVAHASEADRYVATSSAPVYRQPDPEPSPAPAYRQPDPEPACPAPAPYYAPSPAPSWNDDCSPAPSPAADTSFNSD